MLVLAPTDKRFVLGELHGFMYGVRILYEGDMKEEERKERILDYLECI